MDLADNSIFVTSYAVHLALMIVIVKKKKLNGFNNVAPSVHMIFCHLLHFAWSVLWLRKVWFSNPFINVLGGIYQLSSARWIIQLIIVILKYFKCKLKLYLYLRQVPYNLIFWKHQKGRKKISKKHLVNGFTMFIWIRKIETPFTPHINALEILIIDGKNLPCF